MNDEEYKNVLIFAIGLMWGWVIMGLFYSPVGIVNKLISLNLALVFSIYTIVELRNK